MSLFSLLTKIIGNEIKTIKNPNYSWDFLLKERKG